MPYSLSTVARRNERAFDERAGRSMPDADDTVVEDVDVQRALVEMVIESWRFVATFNRAIDSLSVEMQARYLTRSRFFTARLEQLMQQAGLALAPLNAGDAYDGGLPVKILNVDDFRPDVPFCIEQVVEPPIIGRSGELIRKGAVVLREGIL